MIHIFVDYWQQRQLETAGQLVSWSAGQLAGQVGWPWWRSAAAASRNWIFDDVGVLFVSSVWRQHTVRYVMSLAERTWLRTILLRGVDIAKISICCRHSSTKAVITIAIRLRHDYDTTIPRCIRLRRKWSKLRFAFDCSAIQLRSDYDISRAPASIRRDSTRAKNEHVNFSP